MSDPGSPFPADPDGWRAPSGGLPPPPPAPGYMAPPPGYVAYGGPGAVYGSTTKIGGVAKALVILQTISLATAVLVLVLQIVVASKATDFVDGSINLSEFEDALGPLLAIGVLLAAVAIGSLVLLIIWSYRIAGNLQSLGRTITWKPGLTIVVWLLGGCTLNIINFLMLGEHWKASDPDVPAGSANWKSSSSSPLIVAWFSLTISQVVLGIGSGFRAVGGVSFGNDTDTYAEALADKLPFVLLSGAASVGAAVLMIVIIRQLTARHMKATREA